MICTQCFPLPLHGAYRLENRVNKMTKNFNENNQNENNQKEKVCDSLLFMQIVLLLDINIQIMLMN